MNKTKCRSKKSNLKSARGITLLALVITIIVLIILAGVTISALLGDDGIVGQADIAEEKTNTEGEIEQIQMAYNAELMNNKIEKSGPVTPRQLYDRLNSNGAKLDGDNSVRTTPDGFEIEFANGRKYRINVANKDVSYVGGENGGVVVPEGMYSVNEEVTPAPQEIFDIEAIDGTTARITGIKNDYIRRVAKNHYYHIEHDDIDTTLVVPYQVAIDGKMYTVTEVNLDCENTKDRAEIISETGSRIIEASIPDVQRVIYPNTVTKIGTNVTRVDDYPIVYFGMYNILEEVVLSDNLTEIGEFVFASCTNLRTITIPNSVTSIGNYAFSDCDNLKIVKFETETLPTLGIHCFDSYEKQTTYYFKNANALKSFCSDAYVDWMQGEYYYYIR